MENLANKITISRLLLVPVIIVISMVTEVQNEYYNYVCTALIIIFGLGDMLDGYVARKYNQITKTGSFLDPFADKYLVVSVCIVLTYYRKLPLWYLLLVFNKDILVFACWIALFQKTKKVYVKANFFGKSSTVFQIILIFLAYMNAEMRYIYYTAIVSASVTLLAGVIYVYDGLNFYKKTISAPDT